MALELTNGFGKTLFITPCVIMKYILTKFQGIWVMNSQNLFLEFHCIRFFSDIYLPEAQTHFSTCRWVFDIL